MSSRRASGSGRRESWRWAKVRLDTPTPMSRMGFCGSSASRRAEATSWMRRVEAVGVGSERERVMSEKSA